MLCWLWKMCLLERGVERTGSSRCLAITGFMRLWDLTRHIHDMAEHILPMALQDIAVHFLPHQITWADDGTQPGLHPSRPQR